MKSPTDEPANERRAETERQRDGEEGDASEPVGPAYAVQDALPGDQGIGRRNEHVERAGEATRHQDAGWNDTIRSMDAGDQGGQKEG